MFEGWDSFYLLTGGAAGGLIGLLFIVATLTKGGLDADSALRGASVYMTPIVFHLAVVLSISGLACAPRLEASIDGVVLAAAAALGLLASGRVMLHLRLSEVFQSSHWTDLWCYGALPFAAYLALAGSAAAVWLDPKIAAEAVAVSLLALLLIAVRNAWDLVTWISAKGAGGSPPTPD